MKAARAPFAFDAFEALPDPAAILTEDGALLRANPAFRAVFKQWVGPSRPPWGRIAPPAFDHEGERRFEAPSPDGRQFEWTEKVLPDGARLALAHDITKHTQMSQETMRAKTVLFATLTHELRTPLNGVLGMAGLLAQTQLEPAQQNYVAAIRQSGELLLDLISDVLDYAKLEAGRIELENAPFEPEATMQDVAELLSPKAFAKSVEIAVCVSPQAPPRLIGDEGRFKQILFNLAGNAVKFTEAGGVLLEYGVVREGRWRFSVRDSGPGIAPDQQALIFEEFAQADAGIARKHGGTGLGLAIVKKLASALGGEVGLSSTPGQGATFWVDLPLQIAPSPPPAQPLHGVKASVRSSSPMVQRAIASNLMSLGAVLARGQEQCDVILVDWRTPPEAAAIADMKRQARTLIALLPQEDRATITQCRAAGIAHYTLKPVRRASLAERIRIALGAAEESAPEPPRDDGLPEELKGVRVLLAEDNPINALLARTLLTRAGCLVDTVQDGEEAVEAASKAPYDLIFLDIRMPRLDGFGAAQRIRALGGDVAKTPIIALTAESGEEETARALKSGMDGFVTKPIESARLYKLAARFTKSAKSASP